MSEINGRVNPLPGKRLDIQGLRAIAVLMVVVFHAGLPAPGGFVGVDVFFVISGFVITGMLHREWTTQNRINFADFYTRRFKRLFPALALMVAVALLISLAVLSPLGTQKVAAQTGLGAIMIVANFAIMRNTGGYFDLAAHANPFLHTWSLSVEEQFYLIFPILIAFSWWVAGRYRRRIAPIAIVGAITLLSFALAAFGLRLIEAFPFGEALLHGPRSRWAEGLVGFYSPLTRSWEFGAGVLLALGLTRVRRVPNTLSLTLGFTGAALLALSLWLISEATPFPGVWTLLPVTGTLLLLAAGTNADTIMSRGLSCGPMVRIGDWSYSIYLWHWPWIVFASLLWPGRKSALLLAAALSVIPAIASYHWVEMPIRHRGDITPRRIGRLVVATVSAPLIISLATLVAVRHGYWSPKIQAMQATIQQPHALTNCQVEAVPDATIRPCVFNAQEKGAPIYLVGDSTAWHFSEAAIGAGEQLGRPVKVLAIPYCQSKDVFSRSVSGPPIEAAEECRTNYEATIRWLKHQPPGTVVITNLNTEYQHSDRAYGTNPDDLTADPAQLTSILNDGLTSTVSSLERSGHSVLLVQSAPVFEAPAAFSPSDCTVPEIIDQRCVGRMSRTEADDIQRNQRAAIQAVADSTGARVWDPRAFFCPADSCSSRQNGVDLYVDSVHITPAASSMLSGSLAKALSEFGALPTRK